MDRGVLSGIGLAVRIITYTVMAGLVFVSGVVFAFGVNDFDVEVARRATVSSYTRSETAPMGSLMLAWDGDPWFKDYIPLLGYAWWYGFPGVLLLLVAGLAIVYVSRYPRVPGSYLTPTTTAAGVAIALFGVAAASSFTCEYEWAWAVPPDVGCQQLSEITFVPLLLGSLLLVFAGWRLTRPRAVRTSQ